MTGFDFEKKHVFVTGASRGIGYAVARAFAASGAILSILADGEEINEAAEQIEGAFGTRVRPIVCDISDRGAVEAATRGISGVDVLVNNAGLELITPMDDPRREVERTFKRIIEINILGTYYMTRDVLPRMPDGSSIVLTASVWGKSAAAGFSAYCASKHANLGFMRSLAHELAPRRIRVNAVCPGFIRTEASMRSIRADAARTGRSEEEIKANLLRNQALPGLLEPEDVTSTFLFLASDQAKDITGQSLHIDRGEFMD